MQDAWMQAFGYAVFQRPNHRIILKIKERKLKERLKPRCCYLLASWLNPKQGLIAFQRYSCRIKSIAGWKRGEKALVMRKHALPEVVDVFFFLAAHETR
ncbi:Hypothetical protein NTJ_06049 [Nesidiocoris tenuis]|uniref:Uncharacterized protein n=1 Tax=Nesidiocoris tenuis TaxID=355587 RepID=A0ABN7AQP9_9HEMI|nr:Hypothetical protein NTJ_06049 [Nesidiocoris tenuis]